jgi:hypothetical protein
MGAPLVVGLSCLFEKSWLKASSTGQDKHQMVWESLYDERGIRREKELHPSVQTERALLLRQNQRGTEEYEMH